MQTIGGTGNHVRMRWIAIISQPKGHDDNRLMKKIVKVVVIVGIVQHSA